MAGAAIGVVRSQNVVHAALYLVVVLAGAAAQYILLAAEFVAWVQVLIYIGAIVILFLFGIMLTRAPMRGERQPRQQPAAGRRGRVACSSSACSPRSSSTRSATRRSSSTTSSCDRHAPATSAIEHLPRLPRVPFEVVSMLLLAALVGAVVIARRD